MIVSGTVAMPTGKLCARIIPRTTKSTLPAGMRLAADPDSALSVTFICADER